MADEKKTVSHMFSDMATALELATKKTPNSPHLPSYNLPVQQHALNPQDVYFLPNLHKITELSRPFFVLLWFFSEKYHAVHTVDMCTQWQKGGLENYYKSLALKKK